MGLDGIHKLTPLPFSLVSCDGWKPTVEWSEVGSRDVDGRAERPSERARTSQWNQAGNWKAVNVYGAKAEEILARVDVVHGAMSYKRDRQGNITFLLGGSTQIIEKYTYDAFGRPTILSANNTQRSTSAVGNRFMFTGREWLAEINAYDYRHRLYDPDLGRFLQTDPLGLQTEGVKLSAGQKALFSPGFVAPEAFAASETNLYRYCGDDPVDSSDPLGLAPIDVPDNVDVAARAAALRAEALYNSATSDKGMERNIAVVTDDKIGRVSLTRETIGWRDSSGKLRSAPPDAPEGTTRRASAHNHPNGTRISGEDRVAADKRGEAIYVRGQNTERWRPDDDAGKRARHEGGVREVWSERTKKWIEEKAPPLPRNYR